ncbi:Retrovirus-related Pol polyprotein from transposon RE1 [Sesamum angolense]|uniref:Retrovirus-related Pol polyprotein from transposon RE1 n=1 Tax=Sesamum angolense TaxID=2727404 RepID=A0AAE2BWM6_9LAMI|nr:Retrovirus-related Pol polyprotein from transposon RE1 [Sesamum angolense]
MEERLQLILGSNETGDRVTETDEGVEAVQELKSFIEANKHKHWREAMTKEIEAFEKNDTWDLAELPTDVNKAFLHGHLDEEVYMLPPDGYTKATGGVKFDVATGALFASPNRYRRLIYRLLYLGFLRPDISFAVQQLSQFIQLPRQPHWETALHLVHYLKGTPTCGLCFPAGASFKLTAYSDYDWASCPDKHRSVIGYYIFLGGSFVSWKIKK